MQHSKDVKPTFVTITIEMSLIARAATQVAAARRGPNTPATIAAGPVRQRLPAGKSAGRSGGWNVSSTTPPVERASTSRRCLGEVHPAPPAVEVRRQARPRPVADRHRLDRDPRRAAPARRTPPKSDDLNGSTRGPSVLVPSGNSAMRSPRDQPGQELRLLPLRLRRPPVDEHRPDRPADRARSPASPAPRPSTPGTAPPPAAAPRCRSSSNGWRRTPRPGHRRAARHEAQPQRRQRQRRPEPAPPPAPAASPAARPAAPPAQVDAAQPPGRPRRAPPAPATAQAARSPSRSRSPTRQRRQRRRLGLVPAGPHAGAPGRARRRRGTARSSARCP